MSKVSYRLGIDLGTNSLGWCLLKLDKKSLPIGIICAGSRIFSDGREPQRGEPLAVERRIARGSRRRRDRFIRRKSALMQTLVEVGLMPKDIKERKKLKELDPYFLRAEALKRPLQSYELGRILYHLNQRRGFLSNRKTSTKEEAKVIGPKIDGLRTAIEASSSETLGEFLHSLIKAGKTARSRPEENLYPTRAMYRDEFEAIKKEQSKHHEQLNKKSWDKICEHIFYQRPLKKVEPGRCQLYPDDKRLHAALPSYQQFRIAQDLSNLALIDPNGNKTFLDKKQRETLWNLLQKQKTIKFSSIRTKLKLDDEIKFNLEDEKRKDLKGNPTAILLSKEDYFGTRWFELSTAERDKIVNSLIDIEDEDIVLEKAQKEWDVGKKEAENLAELTPEDFIKGYGRFGKKALEKLLPHMRDDGLKYHEAVEKIGLVFSEQGAEKILPRLEYYGKLIPKAVFIEGDLSADEKVPEQKYGKIGNPTVHIGLNQLQQVINEIIKIWGPPEQIVVELARDLKLNQEQKNRLAKDQAANQKNNTRIEQELQKLKIENNGLNRLKYKLWEELNEDPNSRYCPFSGTRISISSLFSHQVEIEHILPLSKTLDDSQSNKTLSSIDANKIKRGRSPFEAFGGDQSPYDFGEILERVSGLPKKKFMRFLPDAMEKFEQQDQFLERQLNDTRYLCKVAKEYLSHICPANKIWVIPGILTAMLRRKLGLNRILNEKDTKDRSDHRHHAIDALVAGLTDRGLLKKVSQLTGSGLLDPHEELRGPLHPRLRTPEPWSGFHKEAEESIRQIIVSHKPDHGIQGQLHEETAYGIIKNPSPWEKENGYNVVRRKMVADLSFGEIDAIRDPDLRNQFQDFAGSFESEKEMKQELDGFGKSLGIRRLKILKKENPIIQVHHPKNNPKHIKGLVPGNIHHVAFWKLPNGKIKGKGVSFFEINSRQHNDRRPHPAAKLILKIHKGDIIKLEHKGITKTARVVSLSPQNKNIWLTEHFEGGNLAKRYKEKKLQYIFLSFSKLKEFKTRKVYVDLLGRVRDPEAIL